jgi:hypothetical protein
MIQEPIRKTILSEHSTTSWSSRNDATAHPPRSCNQEDDNEQLLHELNRKLLQQELNKSRKKIKRKSSHKK